MKKTIQEAEIDAFSGISNIKELIKLKSRAERNNIAGTTMQKLKRINR
ncbi:MAG: hypothetical protein CM15mV98_460 [uncultured marine virus]|nr:MAG: hypothetical protein CM15mV98_460 [uncultured marine virus]